METYAGFEPQIGEIRALRTFRIGPDGKLYPLYSDTAWVDGTNTRPIATSPQRLATHARTSAALGT